MKLKENINLIKIENFKFKTNLISIYFTKKLERENATKFALLPLVLKRGTNNLNSQEEINKELEELYGASFDYGVETSGDNHILKFNLEILNDKFVKDGILKKGIDLLFDIVFNPYIIEGNFNKEYVEQEKENLKDIINARSDDKRAYSSFRCVEETFKGRPYAVSRIGYIEDIKNINEKNLYEFYKKIIKDARIDIYVSGENINIEEIKNNKYIFNLEDRKDNYYKEKVREEFDENINIIEDHMEIKQGNLAIGVLAKRDENVKEGLEVLNAILGVGSNSKLFQNVREKASLAYTAGSMLQKQKDFILIKAGIEIKNYDKAVDIIKDQLEMLKKGEITKEEIDAAKEILTGSLLGIKDEQEVEVFFNFRNDINNIKESVEEKIENIKKVEIKDVANLAKDLRIKTIYFLRD